MRRICILLILAWACLAFGSTARAENPPTPEPASERDAEPSQARGSEPGDIHLGVASCAGSNCHGATRPYLSSSVEQNEYTLWNREDPHSKAYAVLLNERSKRIARNLRLPKPAHESAVCLDCHSDHVPVPLRGKRFDLADGVGCEACHGGGNRYLGPHVSGENTHQDNIDHGLYPTEDPVKRAVLCNQCHVGDDKRFASHRIMGAGHPRLSFELDTYTEVHKHYVKDKDYVQRKAPKSHGTVWAVGQVRASIDFLELFLNGKHAPGGLMPELTFFDCQACHHDIHVASSAFAPVGRAPQDLDKLTWVPRDISGPLEPGLVRLNDSGLVMAALLADRFSPDRGAHLRKLIRTMHQASQADPQLLRQTMGELLNELKRLEQSLQVQPFSAADARQLVDAIIARNRHNDFATYAAAEQLVMAIEALRATIQEEGGPQIPDTAMNALKSATLHSESFSPKVFRDAVDSLAPGKSLQ